MTQLLLFDDFVVGNAVGSTTITLDEAMAADWAIVSGTPAPVPAAPAPPGLVVAAMMRGYTRIASPRPPGNVHAGQRLLFGPPAMMGASLSVALVCARKDFRNNRRWLDFDVTVSSATATHLTGTMRLLWAA